MRSHHHGHTQNDLSPRKICKRIVFLISVCLYEVYAFQQPIVIAVITWYLLRHEMQVLLAYNAMHRTHLNFLPF